MGKIGAGEENRTLVFSLGSCCSTIELHPRWFLFGLFVSVGQVGKLCSKICP